MPQSFTNHGRFARFPMVIHAHPRRPVASYWAVRRRGDLRAGLAQARSSRYGKVRPPSWKFQALLPLPEAETQKHKML